MSTNCEHCGYKDNEVKSGSAISDKGQKIILKVEDRDDLSRDILKVHLRRLISQPRS
jgi:zinc finger protein ZPR1